MVSKPVFMSSAPSFAQVKFWVGEFKCGRRSLEHEARSGRPFDVINKEMCKKVRDLVYSDLANSGGRNSAGIRHFTW